MRVKTYKVILCDSTADIWFIVEAPNKYIAKWCGANLCDNTYSTFTTAKDFKVERFKFKEEE